MAIPPFVAALRARIGHDLLLLPGVVGVVLDDVGRVLLARRSDTGAWGLIGGLLEPGEQVADGLVREVYEETAVVVRPERISGVYTHDVTYPNGDRAGHVITVFRCSLVEGEPRVNDDESLEVGFFPLDALPPLRPDQHQVIADALRDDPRAVFTPPRPLPE